MKKRLSLLAMDEDFSVPDDELESLLKPFGQTSDCALDSYQSYLDGYEEICEEI